MLEYCSKIKKNSSKKNNKKRIIEKIMIFSILHLVFLNTLHH